MKKVYLMRGASGCGKSSYVEKNIYDPLPDETTYTYCSADLFFIDPATQEYKFDVALLGKAHQSCLRGFLQALFRKDDVIVVDNTNTTTTELAPYAQAALAMGYELEVITLLVAAEVAAERNKHGVPIGTIKRQIHKLNHYLKLPDYWPQKVINQP